MAIFAAKGRIAEVNVGYALERAIEGVQLFDLRDRHDWLQGSLELAVHLPRATLEREIEAFVPMCASPVILFCDRGDISLLAAQALRGMGYQRVMVIAGGWEAVLNHMSEVVRGKLAVCATTSSTRNRPACTLVGAASVDLTAAFVEIDIPLKALLHGEA